MMDIVIRGTAVSPASLPVEIVERKGLGHPDSICDAISEAVSRALCRHYIERFGTVLHHNVDKVLLVGGRSEPRLCGGRIIEPAAIYIAGRATSEWNGNVIAVAEIAQTAAREWLSEHLRSEFTQHAQIVPVLRPASPDLQALFVRGRAIRLANDTSCGAGFAPLTPLERLALRIETDLNDPRAKSAHPAIGEDIKIMAVRRGTDVALTVACAVVDRYVGSPAEYDAVKEVVISKALEIAHGEAPDLNVTVSVNAADDDDTDARFITVSGTSAEAGDDGETGRGNRVNGLITPYRPMTLEAAAGKNPLTHVGKLYQLMASDIAHRIVCDVDGVHTAQCVLVSQIGRPVGDPLLVDVAVDRGSAEARPDQIRHIIKAILAASDGLADTLIRGERRVF